MSETSLRFLSTSDQVHTNWKTERFENLTGNTFVNAVAGTVALKYKTTFYQKTNQQNRNLFSEFSNIEYELKIMNAF